MRKIALMIAVLLFFKNSINAQEHSIVRKIIDLNLEVLPNDGSGPTIVSRTLFHTCAAMHDVWAIYTNKSTPFLIGQEKWKDLLPSNPKVTIAESLIHPDSINKAIAYAAYRIMVFRYSNMNGKRRTIDPIENTFTSLYVDLSENGVNFSSGKASDIGNYVAKKYLEFGFLDGSEEESGYEVFNTTSVNSRLNINQKGALNLRFKNRWQPIEVMEYYEEHGGDKFLEDWNLLIADSDGAFLSPHWKNVIPFALSKNNLDTVEWNGKNHSVYLDPGPPPLLDYEKDSSLSEEFKWGFLVNALWSGLADPLSDKKLNISPGHRGNAELWTKDYKNYYGINDGKIKAEGHKLNPVTQKKYKDNWVKLGDYTRVVSEFWVDGINTYSPPGHWLAFLGMVNDHELLEKKWMGKGEILDSLEWDIKAYFTITGAMHDAAIAAWSVKIAYDYVRPISAIRYMGSKGQCSDTSLSNYHLEGLPLMEGKIEVIKEKDPILKMHPKALGKIKILAWKGPDYITDAEKDLAGVGWILAEKWWPYQRAAFITPPFAGYVSGHSCYSFAAAEVLTQLTGTQFFPGGIAEFTAKKNEFLQFENGPSEDLTLQWATYYDAAIETGLSRVYGGIHPPCDDMMGRKMGIEIGKLAVLKFQSMLK